MGILSWIRLHPVFCALVLLLLLGGSSIAWAVFRPKQVPLSLNPAIYTGYYWGNDGFLGRHFYAVVADEGRNGYWEVEVKGPGWNRYRGYYPDGTLREVGEIHVEYSNYPPEPHPDEHNVKWGNYYRPDGTIGAQIRDGTGEQVLWYPDGKLRWKLVLRDYKRVMDELWAEDGTLIGRKHYPRDEGM